MDVSGDLMTAVTWASNALVTAAVTDTWDKVRRLVAGVFGRRQADSSVEQILDSTREALDKAPAAQLQRVQAEQAQEWAIRFKDLLRIHPDAEAEVRGLAAKIRATMPPASVAAFDHSIASIGDVTVTGYGGVTGAVIHIEEGPPDPRGPGRA